MGLMLGEFTERLYDIVEHILPVREIVCKTLDEAEQIHPSKQIIVVEKSCPFMDYLIEIEKERGIEGQTKFAVFCNDDGSWYENDL